MDHPSPTDFDRRSAGEAQDREAAIRIFRRAVEAVEMMGPLNDPLQHWINLLPRQLDALGCEASLPTIEKFRHSGVDVACRLVALLPPGKAQDAAWIRLAVALPGAGAPRIQ
jgi:hypothetical protein